MASETGAKVLNFPPRTAEPESMEHHARTALLVVLNYDGSMQLFPDVNHAQYLDLDRQPHPDEVSAMGHFLADDIVIRKTAGTVQSVMAMLGQQAMQAQLQMQEAQAAQAMVTNLGDLKRGK